MRPHSLPPATVRCAAAALLAALAWLAPAAGHAQRASLLSVEARVGAAFPAGEVTEADPGIGAGAGPLAAVAALWHVAPALAVRVGYARSWLSCERCGERGIDDRVVDTGFDAGIRARLPLRPAGVRPWVGAGAILHRLVFSDGGSTLSSEYGLGYRASAGVAVPLSASLAVTPAAHYARYSTELDLGAFPDRSVEVAHLGVGVGLTYRF